MKKLSLFILIMLLPVFAHAQNTATMSGTAQDGAGTPLAYAYYSAQLEGTGGKTPYYKDGSIQNAANG